MVVPEPALVFKLLYGNRLAVGSGILGIPSGVRPHPAIKFRWEFIVEYMNDFVEIKGFLFDLLCEKVFCNAPKFWYFEHDL